MAPDWEATVEAQAAELKPLIANKTVVGLCVRLSPYRRSRLLAMTASRRRFVGDEMVCNGLPFKDFTALVTKIRAEVGPGIPYAPLLRCFHGAASCQKQLNV